MKLSRGVALLASNAAVAGLGAAVMLVLVRTMSTESSKIDPMEAEAPSQTEVFLHVDRLAFAPPGLLSHPQPSTSSPALRPGFAPIEEAAAPSDETLASASEDAPWSTESRSSPTARPLQSVPGLRFPWQRKVLPDRPIRYTLKTRLAEISPAATARLERRFQAAKAAWPPEEITFIAIKDEKVIELHAKPKRGSWAMVHRYRVLAASGKLGPKLLQGDRQVPEGLYRIAFLNANSAFHVSLRVNYPNAFDLKMAKKEGRQELGGDIMIHGKNLSAGCLAVGDEAAEELFVLAAKTGLAKVKMIIAPTDLRHKKAPSVAGQPEWLPGLYTEIAAAMTPFDAPQNIATSSTSPASGSFDGLMSFFSK